MSAEVKAAVLELGDGPGLIDIHLVDAALESKQLGFSGVEDASLEVVEVLCKILATLDLPEVILELFPFSVPFAQAARVDLRARLLH